METRDALKIKFDMVLPLLDERQRRTYLATEAATLGHGGVALVAQVAGVSRTTVHRGLSESPDPTGRVREPGGGRRSLRDTDPGLVEALDALVAPETRGDPMSVLRWTCKSTRNLAEALTAAGHKTSHRVVGKLLGELGYSLQANAKTREGKDHPDRDAQFRYIGKQVRKFQKKGEPVVSVDGKKKELIGTYKNGGQEWWPKGKPEEVNTHDFMDKELGKAVPYGVYDVGLNEGWVSVGRDHDTSVFAVESLRRWWNSMGVSAYAKAKSLLVCADGGGSNGHRLRLWKLELARFASESGLKITVCHFPPGTSKWNKIEHRMFSHITMNWRGRPLVSFECVVQLIGATTTREGLRVKAELDAGTYPTKIKVSDKEMASLPLDRHKFHGDWNYTLAPAGKSKSQ
jgi:hypothetical protein